MSDDTTLEFRDGRRAVPDYLYAELALLETHRMKYEDALAEANRAREQRYIDDALHQVQVTHFANHRRGF